MVLFGLSVVKFVYWFCSFDFLCFVFVFDERGGDGGVCDGR